MTKGDFILGIITSLIAEVLIRLAWKFHPKFPNIPIIELSKELFRGFPVNRAMVRVLSCSAVFAITISLLLNAPVPTVLAPSADLKVAQTEQNSLPETEHYFEEAEKLFKEAVRLSEGKGLYRCRGYSGIEPDTIKKALELMKKREYEHSLLLIIYHELAHLNQMA